MMRDRDPLMQFAEALAARGIVVPAQILGDGSWHRADVDAPGGKGDASYILHLDGVPAGSINNWRDGLGYEAWRADVGRELNDAERRDLAAKAERDRAAREAEEAARRDRAKAKARELLSSGKAAGADHPYLLAKGVPALGLMVCTQDLELAGMQCRGALMVPLVNGRETAGLQLITLEGKRYLGPTAGLYYSVGKLEGDAPILIAEGAATAHSLHQCTGYAVAAAMDAGNLERVTRSLHERHPTRDLIVCADDDWQTKWPDGRPRNTGRDKAIAAASAVGGRVAIPSFQADRPVSATDFNDLHRLEGAEAVRSVVAAAGHVLRASPGPSCLVGDPGASGWPAPGLIHAPLKPVPEFSPEVLLPEALRDWIMDEAERMPCVPDFVAAPAIVALGSIVSPRCAVKPKSRDDWVVATNLWGGAVGGPSSHKSPAQQAALRPLGRLVRDAIKAHERAMLEYETQRAVFEAREDAIEGRLKAAAKERSGVGVEEVAAELLKFKQDAAAEAPVLCRFKTNDTTVEKLGEILRDTKRGILVERDELVGLLAAWDRDGREGDRAFFLEAWNGTGSFDTDRIGRGSIFIEHLCASIYGGIQPDKLTSYLEQAAHGLGNDGMLQRFQLLVYPDSRPWEWRDRAPSKSARDRAFAVFESLASFDPVEWGARPADDFVRFSHFRFAPEAQELYIEWSRETNEAISVEDSPIVAQHLAKYAKLFPALALIFHLVECAANGRRGDICEDSAIRAAAWCQYLEAHARRCYGLLADDGLRAAQALAERIRQGKLGDGFTPRDVRRHQWRYLATDEAVRAAIDWLSDEGWLREIDSHPATGRRTSRYVINPQANGARQ